MMVKIAIFLESIDFGGAQTHVLNNILNLQNNDYEFTVIYFKEHFINLSKDFTNLGVKLIYIDKSNSILCLASEINKLFISNNYDVVHSHLNFRNSIILPIAYLNRVRTRVSHSHTTITSNNLVRSIKHLVLRNIINLFSTDLLACSLNSGKYLYAKKTSSYKFKIIHNAINSEKFLYSSKNREILINKYDISKDARVIGHIGDFSKNKNRIFIFNLIRELINTQKTQYKLILIGGSFEDYNELMKFNSDLRNNIIFINGINPLEIHKYYSLFDLLLLPSFHEGSPYTLIESQFNGLNCLVSKTIDSSISFTNLIEYIDINKPNIWIEKIVHYTIKNRPCHEIDLFESTNTSYVIDYEISKIKQIYSSRS